MKKTFLILFLILAIGLGAALVWNEQSGTAKQSQIKENARELEQAKSKIHSIEEQLKEEEETYKETAFGAATLQILFTEPKEEVYCDAYPIMEKYGYVGMLAFSDTQFPGEEGMITVAECQELLGKGWGVCINYDTGASDANWLATLKNRMNAMGISSVETVYFTEGTYASSYEETLLTAGFQIVIHHGEESLALVQTASDQGSLWKLGAVGMKSSEPKYRLNDAVSEHGNMVFTVGFTKNDEQFDSETFTSMMNVFKNYTSENQLFVLNTADARTYRAQTEENHAGITENYEKVTADLNEQLKEAEEEYNRLLEEVD